MFRNSGIGGFFIDSPLWSSGHYISQDDGAMGLRFRLQWCSLCIWGIMHLIKSIIHAKKGYSVFYNPMMIDTTPDNH